MNLSNIVLAHFAVRRFAHSTCRRTRTVPRFIPLTFCLFGAVAASAVAQTWDGNGTPSNGGSWQTGVNWSPDGVPGAGANVVLPDINTTGDIISGAVPPAIIGPEHPSYTVYDTLFREVTLDAPATVNSVLIEEYPFPPPPSTFPPNPITGAPHRNVLKLNAGLSVDSSFTLRGSRAILELNGQVLSVGSGGPLGNVVVEAPIYLNDQSGGHYWHRNRIGRNVSLNDGLDADLPASLVSPFSTAGPSNPFAHPFPGSFDYSWGKAYPVLPYIGTNLLFVPVMTNQTPLPFSTNEFPGPNSGPVSGATSGTIQANLDSQGMVWLNNSSTIIGKVNSHSAFGYFRYDSNGVPANLMNFGDDVFNYDQHAIMDINGRGFYTASVTNHTLGTMYMRSRTDIRNQWTNQSGGQFMFQPTVAGNNPNDPDGITGNLFRLNRDALNEGFQFATDGYPPPNGKPGDPPPGFISAPYHPSLHPGLIGGTPGSSPAVVGGIPGYAVDSIFPFASQADFDGDLIYRDTGTQFEVLDFYNRNGAIMTMRGKVNLGLIDRTPTADLPNFDIIDRSLDRIATLRNESGGFYTYEPRNPASQEMDITGEIINDGSLVLPVKSDVGEPQNVNIRSVMNLFGRTFARGRFLPTRPASGKLLTNTNGAVLNYSALIDIGIDQLPNDSWIDVPHGNLNNSSGTINGFSNGNMVFHGGNQINSGTITLSDAAQFTIGRQGSSTFDNFGTLASVVYSGPEFAGYNPATFADTPTFNSGILNNYGLIQANASTTLNLNTAPVNNFGQIALNGGLVRPFQGTVNYGTTTFRGGAISGPFFLNLPSGLVNGQAGGEMNANTFVNSTGAIMSLGGAGAAALQVNSSTVTQSGTIILSAGFNFVVNNTALVNSGSTFNNGGIFLGGAGTNVAAPARNIINQGSIAGSGVLGATTSFTGNVRTNQVVNVSGASIDVATGNALDLDGTLMPDNFGTINIFGPNASLGITAGTAGGLFVNSGDINLSAGILNDRGLGRGFRNDDSVVGNGVIDFTTLASGILNSSVGSMTASGGTLSLNPSTAAVVGNQGLMTVQPNSTLLIPNAAFTNQGKIQLNGGGATLTNGGGPNGFINAVGADLHALGLGNVVDFAATGGGASVVNNGRFAVTGTPLGNLAINPVSGQAFINNGDFYIDPSAVTVGTAGSALFTNNGNTELVNSSLAAGAIVNPGTIVANGPPPVGLAIATGLFNNTNGSFLANGGANFATAGFTNDGGLLSVTTATTGTTAGFSNLAAGGLFGNVEINGGSSLTTQAIVNSGVMSVLAGSTLATNQNAVLNTFTNTGSLSFEAGSSGLTGAFANNFVAGVAAGNVEAGGGSLLRTGAFADSGDVVVTTGSQLRTDSSGVLAAFTIASGTVTIADTGSFWNTAAVTQTNGSVRIQGGAHGDTSTYALTTGSISLSSPSSVGGTQTLRVRGTFTNTGGTVEELNGATFLTRAITNSGSISLQQASDIRTNEDGNDNSITNTGLISLKSGSTGFTGGFSNIFTGVTNGDLVLEGTSTFTSTNVSNAGGIIVGSGSALNTGGLTNTGGTVDVTDAGSSLAVLGPVNQTNGSVRIQNTARGLVGGVYNLTTGSLSLSQPSSVAGTQTLNVMNVVTNTGGSISQLNGATFRNRGLVNASSVSLQQASSMLTRTVTNGGSISLESASTLNTNESGAFMPFTNEGVFSLQGGSAATVSTFSNNFVGTTNGDVVVDGGSTLTATSSFSNSGGVIVFGGSTLGTGSFTNSGGTVDVSDSGSFFAILGPISHTNGSIRIQNGGHGIATAYTLDGGSLSLSDPSSVAGTRTLDVVNTFTSRGSVLLQNSATLRPGRFINNAVGATLTATGASSLLTPLLGNNLGSIDIEAGSLLDTDNGALTFSPFNNEASGTVTVAGTNSRMFIAETTNAGAIAVNHGGRVVLNNGGTLTNRGMVSLVATDSLLDVSGSLQNLGGTVSAANQSTVTITRDFNNEAGMVSLSKSTFSAGGRMTNQGDLTLSNFSVGTMAGMGVLHLNTVFGNIDVNSGSKLTIPEVTAFVPFQNDGSVRVSSAGTFEVGGVTNSGTMVVNDDTSLLKIGRGNYAGNGRVNIANGGKVTVGTVPAVPGSYSMTPGAFLSVDRPGSQLTVNGPIIMTGVVGNRAVIKVNNGGAITATNLVIPGPVGPDVPGNAVRIDPATMTILQDANFTPQDIFEVDGGSFFNLGDDFDNAQQVSMNWNVSGKFTLNGGGADNQRYEVSGYDYGNTTNGTYPTLGNLWDSTYVANYAIGDRPMQGMGTLHATTGSIVSFVNDRNNLNGSAGGTDDFSIMPQGAVITSTGALAGGEALYVNRLVIDPSTAFSLDQLHVYYREVSFDSGATFQTGQFSDVLVWLANGVTFAPGSDGVTRYPIPFTGPVPEPGTLLLAAVGTCLIWQRRRREDRGNR